MEGNNVIGVHIQMELLLPPNEVREVLLADLCPGPLFNREIISHLNTTYFTIVNYILEYRIQYCLLLDVSALALLQGCTLSKKK